MSEVLKHYDEVLGSVYSWTLGSHQARVDASEVLFASLLGRFDEAASGAPAGPAKRALDLGCGTGVQTLALARLGLAVSGIDFSDTMLAEYRERTAEVGAQAHQLDIAHFDIGGGFDAAVCLGDTVSHLQSWEAVDGMFKSVAAALNPGAGFILATRDHSRVYRGDERFILVRADEQRSLTCFVEDAGPHIRVTDLLHSRVDGEPKLVANSYLKLRVCPDQLIEHMADAGLTLASKQEWKGVHVLFTRKAG